ncbi:MAG: symmetrical bis(5'-nucleosyl)-tetraphosphatase [Pseudomonadota bacterium]
MATYAVGDLQGCLRPLLTLLDTVGFGPDDRLWLVGDLINRGPESLQTLRFVRDLGDACVTVLGNHDLHLLAIACGAAQARRGDTLADILAARDRAELLEWLRFRPLLHHADGWTMVHAGLPPQWDLATARAAAAELEAVLRGPDSAAFFASMYGDGPALWSPTLRGAARLRYITNAFTRMRYVTPAGALTLREKGPPASEAPYLSPWFAHPARRSVGHRIVFGHWATLQLDAPVEPGFGVYPLDDGCVWGRQLSAIRLEDQTPFNVPAAAG